MDKDTYGYYVTNAKGDKLYWDGTDWKPRQPSLMQRLGGGLSQAGKGVRAGLDALTGLPSSDILQGKPVNPKTSPDPLSIMQRHPYLTAAATGALTGPSFGLPAALEAIPGAGAGVGALEQMGYQGISEKGEELAGPKHPILGALPGLLAPFASPALTAMGGGRMAAKAATEAATGQAAETTGQKIAEKGLGMTESEAKGLARPKQIEAGPAEQLSGTKSALWNARREAREKVGQQYNPIYEPLDKLPLEPEHLDSIKAGVKDARAMVRARGQTLSPTANKLLGSLGPKEKAAEQAAMGHFGLAKPPDTLESIAEEEGWEDIEPRPKGKTVVDESAGLTEVQPVNKKSGLKTIGQVRGRLSQLRQAADNPSLNSVDRSALYQASKPLVEILDSVVPEEQKELLRSINAQYAQVSKVLPFKSMLAMNRAGTLPELGKAWFGEGNKAATSLVLAGMNDEQKGLMRKAFASYALETQGKDSASFLADNKDLIRELGFPKELSSIGEWKKLVTAKQRMTSRIPNLPSQQQFTRGVQRELARSGFTPEQLDAAGKALYDQAQRNPNLAARRLLIYLPMSAAMGYGVLYRDPALWVPVGATMIAYLGKNAMINSRMLPLYRDVVMGGWTAKGGRALGKAIVAATRDSLQNPSLTQQLGGAPSAP